MQENVNTLEQHLSNHTCNLCEWCRAKRKKNVNALEETACE